MRLIAFLLAFLLPTVLHAGWFGPDNMWECILDEMPGVKNDPAAFEILRQCRERYPSKVEKQKSSFFGVSTAGECVLKYAEDVSSERGAIFVRQACNRLYPR